MKKILLTLVFLSALSVFGYSQSVTTQAATNVTNYSAQLNGLAAAASQPGTDVYYRWKTSPFGSWNDVLVAEDVSTSSTSYPYTLNGLSANTKYYFEIATWDGSTLTEGSTLNFTTNPNPTATTGSSSNVGATSADVAGTVNAQGNSDTYNCIFYYRVNGTTTWSKQTASPSTVTGSSGDQSESATISGLSANTTYDYAMVLEDNQGIPDVVAQGSVSTFTTTAPVVPTVSIGATIGNITTSSASNTGNDATDDGGASITDKGICWNTTGAPTTSDSYYSTGTTGTGTFNGALTGLSAGTLYYVRAYATNSAGTGYSSTTREFKTLCDAPTSSAATGITATGFTANWSAVTGAQKYYLDVSTASDFSTFVSGYDNLDVGNVTGYAVSGLTASSTYYYRVRAYNDGGADGTAASSANSSSQTVNTLVEAPTVQASDLRWETINGEMVLRWTRGNGDACIVVMKEGSAVTDPTAGTDYIANSAFGSGSDVGNNTYCVYKGTGTSVSVSGLSQNVDYYFKVMEYNDGSAKGNLINYNTSGTDGWSGSQGNSQLPVDITRFDAEAVAGGIALTWNTASEINNHYFDIERSDDGLEFVKVGRVEGNGNSNVLLSYRFIDKNAPKGLLYYRLKQVDFDGNAHWSKVAVVASEAAGALHILQAIPQQNRLEVSWSAASGKALMTLYDAGGQLIERLDLTQHSNKKVRFDMSNRAHGIYLVVLDNGSEKTTKKVQY